MDFKIGDTVEEADSTNNKHKRISIIVIIILSLFIGLMVFLISNTFFSASKKNNQPPVSSKVSVEDEIVKDLYKSVTYGVKGVRFDKFIKEQSVKLEDFSNYEKIYYALKFVQREDFASTGQVNENGQKIYNISSAKVKNYMQKFFGTKVNYSTSSVFSYPFNFQIDNKNVGTLTYSVERDGFDTVFLGLEENQTPQVVEPYYAKLVDASKKSDGTIELTEKIIYTKAVPKNGTYDIYIYKDYEKTIALETKFNVTQEALKEKPISVDDYLETSATITYQFKSSLSSTYFYSSLITN